MCIVNAISAIQIFGLHITSNSRQGHKAVGKETGKTNHIDALTILWSTNFTSCKRHLSFSKNINNHIGAIWNFVHHYNAALTLLQNFLPLHVKHYPKMNHLQKSSTSQKQLVIPLRTTSLKNIKIQKVDIFSNFNEVA